MANVSKLLYTTTDPEHFLANLEPDVTILLRAQKKVRSHLREVFAAASADLFGEVVIPRFFTQGSSSYRTLNEPAWPPRQQKDLDDGCYLPLSFVRGERPSKAAKLFFQFVDAALINLAKTEGWIHIQKPTCVRLEIARDGHIDVPLYAIPDDQFRLLEDRALQKSMHTASAKADNWDALPSDAVLLAHREDDWVESDPRKIHGWFQDAVKVYGTRLRRDSRYLKAWRDFHELDKDNLTSIVLMACVWHAYEAIRGPFLPDREDERLFKVVERLPTLLESDVFIGPCGDEDLNRMSATQRKNAAAKARELGARLKEVLSSPTDKRSAVDIMRLVLGERVPDMPELVAITAAATVLSHPKKVVAAPEVGRSQSG